VRAPRVIGLSKAGEDSWACCPAASVSLAGNATVDAASLIRGRADLDIGELADIAPFVGEDIAGAVAGDVRFDAADGKQKLTLALAGPRFRIDTANLERLSANGTIADAFGVTALLMGTLGTVQMASHQIALNIASLTFMVPLGVGAAAAVQVGQAVGRGDPADARRAALASLLLGVTFMVMSAVVMLLIPDTLAGIYTELPAVRALAATLIPIAGAFQVFDGTQVVSAGALRGLGDTRVPMLIGLVGFWLVGLPVSVALGFGAGLGPIGLWWGLVAGLAAVGILSLAVWVVVGDEVLGLFGFDFRSAHLTLVVLGVGNFATMFLGLAPAILQIRGARSVIYRSTLGLLVVNVGLTFLLVPFYGHLGAALAFATSALVVGVFQALWLEKRQGIPYLSLLWSTS